MSTAIILAGGLGTRLRSVVRGAPKPMAPIDGKPFLQYQLDYWIAKGIDNFVFSVGYKHEVILDFFGEKYLGAPITYSVEETPMGTGGGFLLALKMVVEDLVLLLNGDTFFDVDFEQLKALHVAKRAAVTFSMFNNTGYMLLRLFFSSFAKLPVSNLLFSNLNSMSVFFNLKT